MQVDANDYIIGLWYIHGWFYEDEIDIQITVSRKNDKAPWECELRTRKYNDNKTFFTGTEDEKTFYDIKFGDQAHAPEEVVINKIEKMAVDMAAGLKGTVDRIMVHGNGEKFMECVIKAKKPWIKMKIMKLDEAKAAGLDIPEKPEDEEGWEEEKDS